MELAKRPPCASCVVISDFRSGESGWFDRWINLEVRKRAGYMPKRALYPDLSVFDYLKFMVDLRQLRM
jgi:ABC-type uncharacterized transport system ATPase subunit